MEPLKILVLAVLAGIVVSLGKAMFHLSSGPDQSAQTAKALTIRISLSIALFVLLMLGWYLGKISPHSM
jgi:hypothetical protein